MKTTMIISLLCLSAMGSFAQSNMNDDKAMNRQAVKERAKEVYDQTNGNMGSSAKMSYKSSYSSVHAAYPDAPANAVPATPSSPYVALQDPPCYKYKSHNGIEVMECPGARFLPDGKQEMQTARVNDRVIKETNSTLDVQREGTYLGYYSNIHALYPQAPRNAVAAWPTSSDYTPLQNPPCYKYVNKRGLEVMECPGARFAPESNR